MCDTGWHPEHMTGTGRLQAWLKGSGNWILRSWRTLYPTRRQEKAFLLVEGNWRVERGESSHSSHPSPPTVPLSNAGGIAVLTVSVLTGRDSPNCRPPPVGWERWNHSTVSTLYWWLEDTALLRNVFFFCHWAFNRSKLSMKDESKSFIKLLWGGKSITMSMGGSLLCTSSSQEGHQISAYRDYICVKNNSGKHASGC